MTQLNKLFIWSKLTKRKKIVGSLAVISVVWFSFCLPNPLFDDPVSLVLEDQNGNLLGGRIAKDGQWRFPVSDSVPKAFKICITEFEDKRFDVHFGIDPIAIARAFKLNFNAGKVVSGGSTISMQVIRLSRKGKRRTYFEKIIEVIQAFRLELKYSKKEILNFYSSYAPFGGNVVGLETASWKYFGRSSKQLSWAEHATLAVLPNRPSIINPSKNRDLLEAKRNELLKRLLDKAYIDSTTYKLSLLERLPQKPKALPSFAPHLLDRLKQTQNNDGGRIVTSIDLSIQLKLNAILHKFWMQNKQTEVHNIAAMVTDVSSKKVVAYVGNVGYYNNIHGGAVDMITKHRSTGSIIKPLLYASCLNEGVLLPNMLLSDIPTYYGDYSPQNYNKEYSGAIPASEALVKSLNVPTVRMLSSFGQQRFYNKLKKLGMHTLTNSAKHYGLSLILGGAETTMEDLSSMYAGLAISLNQFDHRKGQYCKADFRTVSLLDKKDDIKESLIDQHYLSAGSLYETFDAMSNVARPGIEFYWRDFNHRKKIAWKTGTSFGSRDAWAVGVTPKYVVIVWVGNSSGEGRPNLTGTYSAGPVLFEIFDVLNYTDEWFVSPNNDMVEASICRISGHKAGINCIENKIAWIPKQGSKTTLCPYHKKYFLDPYTKEQVTDKCMDPLNMEQKIFFVLPPAQEWYYKHSHPEYQVLPDFKKGCMGLDYKKVMELIYPKKNLKLAVARDLDGKKNDIIFEAKHRNPSKVIYWHIDDYYIGSTKHIHEFAIQPTKGRHILTIIDEEGEMVKRSFEIIEGVQ